MTKNKRRNIATAIAVIAIALMFAMSVACICLSLQPVDDLGLIPIDLPTVAPSTRVEERALYTVSTSAVGSDFSEDGKFPYLSPSFYPSGRPFNSSTPNALFYSFLFSVGFDFDLYMTTANLYFFPVHDFRNRAEDYGVVICDSDTGDPVDDTLHVTSWDVPVSTDFLFLRKFSVFQGAARASTLPAGIFYLVELYSIQIPAFGVSGIKTSIVGEGSDTISFGYTAITNNNGFYNNSYSGRCVKYDFFCDVEDSNVAPFTYLFCSIYVPIDFLFASNQRFVPSIYYTNFGFANYNYRIESAFEEGRNSGGGYQTGYNDGFNIGLSQGVESGIQQGINQGYTDGYGVGRNEGYNSGYAAGLVAGGDYTFMSLIGAVIDAPIKAITDMLDFEILGFNMSTFLLSLFTLAIILKIVSLITSGGGG